MSLIDLEEKYISFLNKNPEELASLYKKIKHSKSIDLDKNDITKAILLRMSAYYVSQQNIKEFLNKRYVPAAADFFVETVAFYLKVVIDTFNTGLELHSERNLVSKKGSIRPDISVWKNNIPVSVIECKTQLGWNRDNWEKEFLSREKECKKIFSDLKLFLIVMCSENWKGFPNSNKVGKQYFTMSSEWPRTIKKDNLDTVIVNPIEPMFKQIVSI